MWIFTPYGFISIVLHDPRRGAGGEPLTAIRARRKEHLEALIARTPDVWFFTPQIRDNEGTDYAFRILVTHAEAVAFVAELVKQIDYSNFKNEAHTQQDALVADGKIAKSDADKYIGALHRIWGILYDTQRRLTEVLGFEKWSAPKPKSKLGKLGTEASRFDADEADGGGGWEWPAQKTPARKRDGHGRFLPFTDTDDEARREGALPQLASDDDASLRKRYGVAWLSDNVTSELIDEALFASAEDAYTQLTSEVGVADIVDISEAKPQDDEA